MKRRSFLKRTIVASTTGVAITSEIEGTTEIISVTVTNPTPFATRYTIGEGVIAAVKSRFKMGKTTDVIAIVKAVDEFYTSKTNVFLRIDPAII